MKKIRNIPIKDLIEYLQDIEATGVTYVDIYGEQLDNMDKIIIENADGLYDTQPKKPLTREDLDELWL